MQTHYGWMIASPLQNQKHLHPVEIFSYIAWTWHGIFRFAYAVKVETFLKTWLLAVKLIRNMWKETPSFNAEKNQTKEHVLLFKNFKKKSQPSMLKNIPFMYL